MTFIFMKANIYYCKYGNSKIEVWYCDESVSRGRMTGTRGRGTGTIGTKGRTIGTKERGTRNPMDSSK